MALMASRRGRRLATVVLLASALPACAMFEGEEKRRVIVPDEMLKQSDYQPDGVIPRSRYVVRMTDGERDWEVEFPEVANGYEIRIPLQGEPKALTKIEGPPVTAADRAILEDMVRQNPDPTAADGTKTAVAKGDPDLAGEPGVKRPGPRVSYLSVMSEVRELYRTRNFEVALMKIVDLESDYPGNDKLLAMKGSLYRQLGRAELAREAWEQALKINPQNQIVIDALSRLGSSQPANEP